MMGLGTQLIGWPKALLPDFIETIATHAHDSQQKASLAAWQPGTLLGHMWVVVFL